IFSRGPKGAARSAIFIGGRDVVLAADMADRARGAMLPPFAVSTITDPSGACTTAAAMVACVEAALARDGGAGLRGRRVVVLGSDDLPFAKRLKVAADINAVPPAGIAGVGATDDAKPLAGTGAVGIGALAIGNVKYQTQHRLLERMTQGGGAQHIGFAEA